MSSVASGHLHRSTRSARCLVAAGLVALVVVLTAVSLVTGRALGVVAVVDAVAAIGAGWSLHTEIMRLRRQAASERAAAAMRAAAKARSQADEHVVLMNTLTSHVRFHQAAAAQLDIRVQMLETELATLRVPAGLRVVS